MFQLRPESLAAPEAELPMQVIRRNGTVSKFDASKISVAMTKAFLAVEGHTAAASRRVHEVVEQLTAEVVGALSRRMSEGRTFHIEDVQDQVELALMRSEHHKVARAYVLYRDERTKQRAEQEAAKSAKPSAGPILHVTLANGTKVPLDTARLALIVDEACAGLDGVDAAPVVAEVRRNIYDGISQDELALASVMAARTLVEQEPNYAYVSARLLLDKLRTEVLSYVHGAPTSASQADMAARYPEYFPAYIKSGIKAELVDPDLGRFDLKKIAAALKPERDLAFQFLGLQTLYDRYFLHERGNRIELPQAFFMRVAMGLAVREIDREARAIEFYDLLSSFDFMASTPTLFNSGTLRPQLSSCFLTTVADDLDGIFKSVKDNALLAKYSGGLGNDWTRVRGLGAHIKGTNGESQGVVPFLKVANDTAIAVNQGGKRKGAVCAYLETWHIDIEEFLDLRKNTGDDRRRTHDMNTANWVPDLFMQRVEADGEWTLFSPDETPDLHDLYGKPFAERYAAYRSQGEARGERLAVEIVQIRRLVGREESPVAVGLDPLHEQVRHPSQSGCRGCGGDRRRCSCAGRGILRCPGPGLQIGADRALALATLVDGDRGVVGDLQERHHALALAVGALDVGTKAAHAGPVVTEPAGIFRQQRIVLTDLKMPSRSSATVVRKQDESCGRSVPELNRVGVEAMKSNDESRL